MDNSVFKLISEMTKAEKEYFTKYKKVFKDSSNSNYFYLYEKISKNGLFNINDLTKKSSSNNLIKNLSSEKNRLLEKILLSLINYKFVGSHSWQIQKDLQSVQILIEKELIEKAEKIIKRIKKIAYQYEEFEFLLLIISLEMSLCFKNCFILDYERFKNLIEERKKINGIIDNLNYLLLIKSELQIYQFNESTMYFNNNHFMKIYGHTSQIPEEDILSNKAKKVWLYINNIIYFMQNDHKMGYLANKQQYELYKSNPMFFTKSEYLQLINNFLYSCALTKDEQMFNTLIDEILNIQNNTKQEAFYITQTQYLRTLELYHQLEKYQEAEKIAQEAEIFIKNIKNLDNTYLIRYLQLLIIRAYIENHNFTEAIHISQIRYKTKGYEFNSSMYKLFEFIAHYKLGNTDNLLYSVNSWAKTIQGKRKQFLIEKVLIRFFRNSCNKVSYDEKKYLLTNVIKQLKELEKNELKYYINLFFDFTAWFEKELNELN